MGGSELWELGGLGSGSALTRTGGTSTGGQDEEEEDGGEDPDAQGSTEADEGGEEPAGTAGTEPRSSRSVTETDSSAGLEKWDDQIWTDLVT